MHLPLTCALLVSCLWGLTCASALAATPAPAETRQLRCEVTYAGSTQHIAVTPTQDPYQQASVRIRNRFRFKAVQVQGADVTPRIGIYVYLETPQQPLLIQHVLLEPPYPESPQRARVDLLGEQRLYAGPLERELIYRCFLEQATP